MQTHDLIPHPAHPPEQVSAVQARVIGRDANWLALRWRIEGSRALVVPAFGGKGRADGLWRTTCFELFLRPAGGESYCEFNLSPSDRWAAYDFAGYREGMADRRMARDPVCTFRPGRSFAIFDAAVPAAAVPEGDCAMNLSCVIEEAGGTKSFWALTHLAEKPDFHNPACFAATLAAPSDK